MGNEEIGINDRILFVDDDPDILKLCTRLFKDKYHVDTANDGLEGFDKIRYGLENKIPFLTVVTDIEMPHLDGIMLLTQLRETGVDGKTPFIYHSGNAMLYKPKLIELGAYAICDKLPGIKANLSPVIARAVDEGRKIYYPESRHVYQ